MSINLLEFTSLLFQFSLSVCGFLMALLFIQKIRQAKGTGPDLSSFLGLAIFTLSAGIMEFFMIYYAYYIYELDQSFYFFYASGYFWGNLGIVGLVFFAEKMLGKTKYAFTIFTIVSLVIGLLFFHTVDGLVTYSTFTNPICVIVVYINFLYSLVIKMKGEIRKKMIKAFISAVGFFVFYIIQTDFEQDFLPFPGELSVIIGMTGIIISTVNWTLIFLSFETFTEFGWREKMKDLFIIAENGASIYHYSFVEKSSPHGDLITAGLMGVKDLLMEMIKSDTPIKVADHQDVKVIFEYGSYSTIVLIADENLRIYHSKLAVLIKNFENLFQDVLPNWAGNLEVFVPTKQLVEELFG